MTMHGRCSWLCLPAAVTSTLLVIDAWFDITTSAPGPAGTAAIAMAVFPELPMAGLSAVLAIRHAPGRTACHRGSAGCAAVRSPAPSATAGIWPTGPADPFPADTPTVLTRNLSR
jgi:hypothetical protein